MQCLLFFCLQKNLNTEFILTKVPSLAPKNIDTIWCLFFCYEMYDLNRLVGRENIYAVFAIFLHIFGCAFYFAKSNGINLYIML